MRILVFLLIASVCCTSTYGQNPEIRAAIKQAGGKIEQIQGGLEVSYHLGKRNVSDRDLSYVAALEDVVLLNLKKTNVSSQGLVHLAEMHTLKKLHLELTKVDDRGLQHLKGLKNLQYLNLFGTKVSDDGIDALARLKGLTHLYVWQTAISEAGIATLRARLPATKIVAGIDLTAIVLPDPDAPVERPSTGLKFIATQDLSDAPKSGNGENIEVVFENKRSHKIRLVWVGYDGKLKVYGELAPGGTRTQNSYENNTWLITDMEDNPLGYFICGNRRAVAVIP